MMETRQSGLPLHASLCEVERGLFRVLYRPHRSETQDLPAYQLAADAEDAKLRIEAAANASGYRTVIWTPPP